jgi:anaerobic magnesium-protoporphyrin IX monomethyl ester cyclase
MYDAVLVYPRTGFDLPGVSIDLPISLISAANLASKEYKIKIIDQRINPYWKQTLERCLKDAPLCVGVTSMTGPQISSALEVSKAVKEFDPHMPVVWGGVHATLLPKQTLENPSIDIVVIGEGEKVFLNLLRELELRKSLDTVKGIVFKKHGLFVQTEAEETVDLDLLPIPPYHLVDVEAYIGSQGKYLDKSTRSLIFFSSRGCPYRCGYCCNPQIYKSKWRGMAADNAYEQAAELVIKYQLDAINFHDEELFVSKNRIDRMAQLIGGRFNWWAQSRMDRIGAMNLPLLEKGGLIGLQPGIESGSDRILKLVRKEETVSTMKETNRKLSRTSIRPLYNFMMGFPTETYVELMQSVDLATTLIDENPNAEITGFYSFIPYPGTSLYPVSMFLGFAPPTSLAGWANFNRQFLATPWVQQDLFKAIMVMSKFVDGRRMLRRLKDNSGVNPIALSLLRQVGKLYQYRWRRHQFDKKLEFKITNYLGNKLFNYKP